MRTTTSGEDCEVREWVEASEQNRELFMETRKFYDLVSMTEVMDSEAESEFEQPRRTLWHRLRPFLYSAAVIAGVIVVAGLLFFKSENKFETVVPTSSIHPNLHALEIPVGQRLRLELADGTNVWLNSNTRLEFPDEFDNEHRLVTIDGAASFEVAKDSVHPFVVRTPHCNIVVRGTTFNVDAYSTSDRMILNLVEGKVEVEKDGWSQTLKPGQRLVLAKDSPEVGNLCEEELEWVNGIMSFNQLPLRDIFKKFERYYGVDISYANKSLGNTKFSGKFYIDEGIDQALKTLQRDMDFQYKIDKTRKKIIIK